MKEAIILTKEEYNDLLEEIRSANIRANLAERYQYQAQCAACEMQERVRNLKDQLNRPAFDALEKMHREELLQWCEDVGHQYNEQDDLQEWIAYCDKKYNKRHYQKLRNAEMRAYVSTYNDGYYQPSAPDKAYADYPYAAYQNCEWKYSGEAHINRLPSRRFNDLYFRHYLLTSYDHFFNQAKNLDDMSKFAASAYRFYKEIRALSEMLHISNPVNIYDYTSLIYAINCIKEAADDDESAWCEEMAKKYN